VPFTDSVPALVADEPGDPHLGVISPSNIATAAFRASNPSAFEKFVKHTMIVFSRPE